MKCWKKTGRLENQGMNREHPDYGIVENSQNTEESPGDINENCCHSDFTERLPAFAGAKNSWGWPEGSLFNNLLTPSCMGGCYSFPRNSFHFTLDPYLIILWATGGARGIIAIVVGNEHGETSSNPGRDWLHFT